MLTISQLDPHFTECLDSVGFSRLTKYPVVRLWRQMNSRLGLLTRIEYSMHNYMSKLFTSDITDDVDGESFKFLAYLHSLTRMKAYVESCIAQLDINNTIDQPPVGSLNFTWTTDDDDAIFHHDVSPFTPLVAHWNEYWDKFPVALLKDYFSPWCEFPSGTWDDAAKMLVKSTYASRRSVVMSRLLAALRTAHNSGWYMVFDTLTLAPDRVKAFYETPNALRDYFRNIGRSVAESAGLPKSKSTKDVYQYFCCPEYGTERGRLHFHCIHLCKHLPMGSVDPNLNRRIRNARQIDSFRGFWSFGNTLPIAMRYSKDAFTRRGWLWPVDKNGQPVQAKPYVAIGYYVSKYVCKNLDTLSSDTVNKNEASKWNHKVQTIIHSSLRKAFRIRMSRGFGELKVDLSTLSTQTLLQLQHLHHTVTPFNRLLKVASRKEIVHRLRASSIADIRIFATPPVNLLRLLRSSMKATPEFSLANFMSTVTRSYHEKDISDECRTFLTQNTLTSAQFKAESGGSRTQFGSK